MIGRIAMPVFSFCIAEGYVHTRDKKRYLLRMGVFALISEIPFDLAFDGRVGLGHQNIMLTFFISILTLMLFTFGCSCFVMHFGVYVEDLSNVINIALRFLFYLTGIFYNIEKRIETFGPYLNRFNPLASLISSMRDCLIYSKTPDLLFIGIWFAVSVLLTVCGVALVYKEENSYLKAV